MMTKALIVKRMFLAFSIMFLNITIGLASSDGAVPPMPDVEIPDSDDAKKLGSSVSDKVFESCYKLYNIPKFKALYSVNLDGKHICDLDISWNLAEFNLSITPRKSIKNDMTELFSCNWEDIWMGVFYYGILGKNECGVRWRGMYVVEGGSTEYLIDQRYRILRKEHENEDGSITSTEYDLGKFDGKTIVNKMVIRVRDTRGDKEKTKYELVYGNRDGHFFPEKIELQNVVSDGGDGENDKKEIKYSLKKISFKDVGEREEDVFGDNFNEGGIKDSARWDSLSKKVIPQIVGNNEDLGTMMQNVRKTRCIINVQITNQMTGMTGTGRLTYKWDDKNRDGILVGKEIEIEMEESSDFSVATALRQFRDDMKTLTLCNIYNLFKIHHVKTKKVKAGYLMTLKPVTDAAEGKWLPYEMLEMKITKDYRIIEMNAKGKDEARALLRLKHKKVGGKWLSGGFTRETSIAGMGKVLSDRSYTYKVKNGIAFLAGITMTERMPTSIGGIESYHRYYFTDWKIKNRKKKLGMPKPAN